MGQYQQELLDLNHTTLELAQCNSQASVAFVLSNRGYGLLWHNPAVGRVTFGANKVEWVAESTKQLDYWITAGDTPAEIEESYARATGTVPMMPEVGLGFWQCKLRYWNQNQLLDVAREYRRRNLPLDVIVYDFENYRSFAGSNLQVGNLFPQQFSKAFYDGLKAEGKQQIVNLVRCAWAGSQRYGALVWSGDVFSDFATLRRQLCAGLNMGIAGIPWWTTDIGGFHGGRGDDPKFRQLLVRWFQWGTFCPVMRVHGDRVATDEQRQVRP